MHLYITVEITSRELEAKTFLACCAAQAGFTVFIGHEDMIRRLAVLGKPGILLDKSIHSEYPPLFNFMKKLGFQTAVNDEEGLVINPKQYSAFNLTDQVTDNLDAFFAWGDTQKDLLVRQLPGMAAKAYATGNPRMDLLQPKLRPFHDTAIAEIRQQYGRFVLINTRFAFANNTIGGPAYRKRLEAGMNGPNIEYLLARHDFDQVLFDEFMAMQAALCERYPDTNFILRPHPSEAMEPWQAMAAAHANLRIVREGNVHKWILASDLLIHNGCATAIESFYLGTPCISYRPATSEIADIKLPNSVSYNVYDLEELCACLEGRRDEAMQAMRPEWAAILKPYIHSDDDDLAAPAMVAKLLDMAQRTPPRQPLFTLAARANARIRDWNRRLKWRMKERSGRTKQDNPNAKWQPMTVGEYADLTARFACYDPDFSRLAVTPAYRDCFCIRKR